MARTSSSAGGSSAEIGERLTKGEQSLLLLNRRGFSTAVFCRQCGHVLDCPNCSVSLTVHHERGQARGVCHYCNYSLRVPTACAKCAAPYLEQSGFGTERVEAEVLRLFPAARVGRVDRDTMKKRGAVTRVLKAFGAHELDMLVGTQMIAKGHDFPGVTLVGVVSADMGLGLADFRAAERTFQLLTQVAGRAGRGEREGYRGRPDDQSGSLQHPARLSSGLRRVLPRGAALPAGDALSAGGQPDQRRRAGEELRGGDGRRARPRGASSGRLPGRPCSAPRRRRWRSCAASIARRYSSRRGTAPPRAARWPPRWRRGPSCCAALPSTSILSACSELLLGR